MITISLVNDAFTIDHDLGSDVSQEAVVRKFYARLVRSFNHLIGNNRSRYINSHDLSLSKSAEDRAARIASILNRRFNTLKEFISRADVVYHYCEESDTFKRLDSVTESDCESCKAAKLAMNRMIEQHSLS